MDELNYRLVVKASDPVLERIRPAFSAMYRGMRDQGLMIPLSDDGADRWINGLNSSLGRFSILAVAEAQGRLAGFAHGAVKLMPDYLEGYMSGVITHVYVLPDYRGHQVGTRLVVLLEEWFEQKKVHSIELQVLVGNPAKEFWEKAGYMPELMQYRRFTGY